MDAEGEDDAEGDDERPYCFCQKPSYGDVSVYLLPSYVYWPY